MPTSKKRKVAKEVSEGNNKKGVSSKSSSKEGGSDKQSRLEVGGEGKSSSNGESKIIARSGTGNSSTQIARGNPTSGDSHQARKTLAAPANNAKLFTVTSSNKATQDKSAIPAAIVQKNPSKEGDQLSSFSCSNENASTLVVYHPQEMNPEVESEKRKAALNEYVRNELFPFWKFFRTKKQMTYDSSKGSIVLKICKDLHIKEAEQCTWWDLNKEEINRQLGSKRSDVTAAIKKAFIGKCGTNCNIYRMSDCLTRRVCGILCFS